MLRKLRKLRNPAPLESKKRGRDGKRRVTTVREASRRVLRQKIRKERALTLEKIYLAGPRRIADKDLARWLGVRTNDLKRRHLPLLTEVGLVVEVEKGIYAVPEDFEARLDEELEVSGCNEAERLQRERYAREREAFATRHQRPADRAPSRAEMRSRRLDVKGRQEATGLRPELDKLPETQGEAEEVPARETPVVSPLAEALRDYLDVNPRRRREPPSWLAITLWAEGRVQGKPTKEEITAALHELFGTAKAA